MLIRVVTRRGESPAAVVDTVLAQSDDEPLGPPLEDDEDSEVLDGELVEDDDDEQREDDDEPELSAFVQTLRLELERLRARSAVSLVELEDGILARVEEKARRRGEHLEVLADILRALGRDFDGVARTTQWVRENGRRSEV